MVTSSSAAPGRDQIRTVPRPDCPLCGQAGEVIHQKLVDRSYAATGEWDFRKCRRPDCGLVWLDPCPIPDDIHKAYQTYYTQEQPEPAPSWMRQLCYAPWHAYLGHRFGYRKGVGPGWLSAFWWLALLHPGGRDELDSLAMYLAAPVGRVLDVGCGSGKLVAQMQAFGWQAEGVEVDPKAVESARKKGIPVKLGQLADQKYPDACLDALHMSHVIEHVHDPAALLQECYRVLKPQGRLVILTPNTQSAGYAQFGSAWLNLDPPRHLLLFNAKNLRALVEKQGFVIDRLESSVRTGWVYGALSRQIQKTGRGEMGDLGKIRCLVPGLLYQLRARAWRRRSADAGDELVLIARKSG